MGWVVGGLVLLMLLGASPAQQAVARLGARSSFTEQDVEALARMLRSEDRRPQVQTVLGWFTIEHARRVGRSVADLLTGPSGQFGPRILGTERRYASTRAEADEPSRTLARNLLTGAVVPSQAIRQRGVSAWVERGSQGMTARKIVARQVHPSGPRKGQPDFGGLWGRLQSTQWYLYHRQAPIQGPVDGTEGEAEQILARLPQIPALDAEAMA